MVAWAVDTYTWAATETELKSYLGITAATAEEDARLELWLATAAETCDHYTGNEFVDDEGVDIPHPSGIKVGIFEYVGAVRSWYNPLRNAGAVEVQTGPLREKYRGGNEGTTGAALGAAAGVEYWWPSKVDVSLQGTGY